MKKTHKLKSIILPLSIFMSFPSLSMEVCSIQDKYNEKTMDFSPNTKISELDTIENIDIEKFTQSIPEFEDDISELKFGALDFFNLEISALQLADGIESGNTKEIVNSAVMLASTFVPTIIDLSIEALGIEFDSNPVSMAVGSSIMVGLNIYNGVETDKSIEQQKQALSDTDKIYKDRASQLRKALSAYRKSIAGDDSSVLMIDENNVSKIVIRALQKDIDHTITNLARDALNKRTLKQETTSLLRNASPNLVGGDINKSLTTVSDFLTEEYSVEGRYIPIENTVHNLNKANWQYVGMWADIPPEDIEQALRGGINTVMISPFKHFLKNYSWLRDVYIPILDNILDKLYVNNDVLYKTLKNSIEYQLTNPDFQENLRNNYNITINNQYAWIKFGSELLENLDLSKEKSEEASIWAERVLIPFISPFLENSMESKIFKELNVQSKIATIVSKLIDSNIDIHNKDAVYSMIKADEASDDLPSSLKNAIDISYNNTLLDVNSLNVQKSDIKPFDVSTEAVNKILSRLQTDIEQGKLTATVDRALNNYAMGFLITPGGMKNVSGITNKLFAAAEKVSALQGAYNGHVNIAIKSAIDKIHATSDEQEIVNILSELGSYLMNNYSSFYDGNIPLIMPNTAQNVEFISFGALPFALNDLKYILEIINAEIDRRQQAISSAKPH